MLTFETHIRADKIAPVNLSGHIELSFEQRQKARQRARLLSGRNVGIVLERGTILRGGDYLKAAGGEIVRVVAADEPVSIARSTDPLLLARAAYHLGNRHVHLEVGQGYLSYLTDHVLDHMIDSLGLPVTHEQRPFEPEGGAYSHRHAHAGRNARPAAPAPHRHS
jgi:urease accessory protein